MIASLINYLFLFISHFYIIWHTDAAIDSHLIYTLPGWKGFPPSNMYAGYLPIANETKFLSYIFIESLNNPMESPVVLWMQGGPGASGFMGLFTEFGPFNLNQYSFNYNVPELIYNPHTWLKYANFIFFESPAGVGYSYCKGPCPLNTDESAAEDAYLFLDKFFESYPEFSTNDFFIAGESYGGIYVPMLANVIIDSGNKFKLKGILVGDGCTGLNSIGGCGPDSQMTLAQFLHGHGQISSSTFSNFTNKCSSHLKDSETCENIFQKIMEEAGKFFIYGLYDECFAFEATGKFPQNPSYDYPCFQDQALETWISTNPVKNIFNTTKDWITHDGNWDNYQSTKDDVIPIYSKLMKGGIRILIYYGDTDAGVPYNGGEKWINSLNLTEIESWRPWTLDGETQVAGYIVRYLNEFSFLTVRGAGHMVPRNKPEAAINMFKNWIFSLPFPNYNPEI